MVHPSKLVLPVFLVPGTGVHAPISSLPGQHQFSLDRVYPQLEEAQEFGIQSVVVYCVAGAAGKSGLGAGFPAEVLHKLHARFPDLTLIADLCLCQFSEQGHCGIVGGGDVLNDATVAALCEAGVRYSQAGARALMPSSMMDGLIGSLRAALDCHGLTSVVIMSQAAKLASACYGPFRRAASSPPTLKDKATYQVSVANPEEALREMQLDVQEGADLIIVKPGLPCLDLVARAQTIGLKVGAFCTSGEYGLIREAARAGIITNEAAHVDWGFSALMRAGASFIASYHALPYARWVAGLTEKDWKNAPLYNSTLF